MNATSETPLMKPTAGLVWLDGSALTSVETVPVGLTLEIRPPSTGLFVLPVYGPMGGATCGQVPTVESVPPRPPSATYRFPSGPNFRPRGLLKPVAKTDTLAARFLSRPEGLPLPHSSTVGVSLAATTPPAPGPPSTARAPPSRTD